MRFLFKGATIFVVLSVLVTFIGKYNVGLWNEPIDRSFDELDELIETEEAPDIIYFSNSYLFTFLDPVYLESKTGLSSVHMGAPSLALPASLLHAEEVLEKHKPKCIVFEVCPRSTGYPNTDSQWKFFSQALMSRGVSYQSLKVLWQGREHWPSNETFVDGASLTTASYNHLNKLDHYDNVTWPAQNYRGFKPLLGGDWALHNSMTDKTFDSLYYNESYRPAERKYFEWYNDEAFCEFLKRTTDNGTKVLLVETLKLDTWSKDGLDTIKTKLEGINPEMIKLINWDTKELKTEMGFRQDDFYDLLHLRFPAALKLCEKVSPQIQEFVDGHKETTDGEFEVANLKCRYSRLYSSERSAPIMHLYFDSIPKEYEPWNLCVKVYPKKLYKDKIGDKDSCYTRFVSLKSAYQLKSELCLDVPMYTMLRKSQIRKVEFYLIGSTGISKTICALDSVEDDPLFVSDDLKNQALEMYGFWVFIVIFPIFVLLFYIVPFRFRWVYLLFVSCSFVIAWEPRLALHVATSIGSSYWASYFLYRWDSQRKRKVLLWSVILLNAAVLMSFMHLSNIVLGVLGTVEWLDLAIVRVPAWHWLAPIGISFYTLQVIGYLIDVYRDRSKFEYHFGMYALAVCYFPKMIAGPIENTERIIKEFKKETHFDPKKIKKGSSLVFLGAVKVWVVASTLQTFVDMVFTGSESKSAIELALGLVFFAVQLYMVFSGLVNIGEGVSTVIGIKLTESFSSPFTATSSSSFWRRWNMSYNTWVNKYLYGYLRSLKNGTIHPLILLVMVFGISAMWYGSGLNVLWWGMFCAIVVIVEKSNYLKLGLGKSSSILKGVITFASFCFSLLFLKLDAIGDVFDTATRFVHVDFVNVMNGSLFGNGLTPSQLWGVSILSVIIIFGEHIDRVRGDVVKSIMERVGILRWGIYLALVVAFLLFRNLGVEVSTELFLF